MTAPKNTLSHQLARPLCEFRPMGWVNAQTTGKHIKGLVDEYEQDEVHPETEALKFYLLQHAMAIVRQRAGMHEPLNGMEVVPELYHRKCGLSAMRMFVYLLLICTREARHPKFTVTFCNKMENKWGVDFADFIRHLSGSHGAVQKLMHYPPDMLLGKYCEGLVWVFRNGKFGSSFGGEKWAVIADTLRDFVNGVISAEMMLDTAFTLAHNGGPIFNKGLGFKHHDKARLMMILDVQASGQIPQLIKEGKLVGSYISSEVTMAYGEIHTALGADESVTGIVDWFKVEKMGKCPYGMLKSQQQQQYGFPEWMAEDVKKQKAAQEEVVAKAAAAKADQEKNWFEFSVNEFVKKGVRSNGQEA